MRTSNITERSSFSFPVWLRTGRLIRVDAQWGAREVKFNPNHDPDNGRFTFKDGGGEANATSQPDADPQATSSRTWGGGGFSGGGGGSFGGGGATGYYMTRDEIASYQAQHPGREPYLTQPGDTLASIAAGHGLTVVRVSEMNGIASGTTVKPGRVLALPGGSLQRTEKNGYTFGTDAIDRTREAKGKLHFASDPKRSKANQLKAGGSDRLRTDDGGHFIAARFGGPSDSFNHFAQDANFNRGGYRALEDNWARDLRSGKSVSVDLSAHYRDNSRRPDSLAVRWTVGGKTSSLIFSNRPKGKNRGY